jgi:excisionase family DNA binding protein
MMSNEQTTPTPPVEFPEVMTKAQAAAFLQLGTSTLDYYVMRGMVPHSRVGKHVRFVKSRLLEWLVENENGEGAA